MRIKLKYFFVPLLLLILLIGKYNQYLVNFNVCFHIRMLNVALKGTRSDENEYRLINDLLKEYNLYARPSLHFEDPTNVTFGLSLSQLIDVVRKHNHF